MCMSVLSGHLFGLLLSKRRQSAGSTRVSEVPDEIIYAECFGSVRGFLGWDELQLIQSPGPRHDTSGTRGGPWAQPPRIFSHTFSDVRNVLFFRVKRIFA